MLAAGGCEAREEEAPEPASEAESASEAEEVAAPVSQPTIQPDPETLPSPPGPSGAGEPTQGQAERMKQVGQALARAAQAASEAEAAGTSPCEQAYDGAVAMARSLHEQMGRAGEADLPTREQFTEGCQQLPEEVQRCMVIGYSVRHQEECRRVRDAHPELMDRVREMVGHRTPGG